MLTITGFLPLVRAQWANRRTPLSPALGWALAAWAAWAGVAWARAAWPAGEGLGPYLALCLTGCAGMAVLGARRPGAAAWNFVVAALLAVLLLPVAEGFGRLRLSPAHLTFLAATLAIALLNYLLTSLAPAALAVGAACAVETARLSGWIVPRWAEEGAPTLLAASPWVGWLALCFRKKSNTDFDRIWIDFRDRFGLVWGWRAREQFNAAARSRWPILLAWSGLRPPEPPDAEGARELLWAVLKRFGPQEFSSDP